MESTTSQDPATLAVQVQSLAAMVEELTRQSQEMRQQLQQKHNQIDDNGNDGVDSNGRCASTLEETNSDLLREMRKEMDELRNAIREKTDWSLDRIVRKTDSPFIVAV